MRKTAIFVFLAVIASPAHTAQHVNQLKGFQTNGIYQVNGFDSVNAFNGNLTISLPIGRSYPLAENASLQLMLHSNANVWDAEEYRGSCGFGTMALLHRRANAGVGWLLTLGRLFAPHHPTTGTSLWIYESPDGADHKFAGLSGQPNGPGYTDDGTFLRMTEINSTERKIEFPDGTAHYFKPSDADESIWLLNRVTRRYGSSPSDEAELYHITIVGDLWTITENGRSHEIRFAPVRDLTCDFCEDIAYDGDLDHRMVQSVRFADGATYTFEYQPATLGRQLDMHTVNRNCMAQRTSGWLLSGIEQPDGTTFDFTYNQSVYGIGPVGLPLSLSLPTGGTIRWEWIHYDKPTYSAAAGEVYFQYSWGVYKRYLDPRNGTSSQYWLYEQQGGDDDDPNYDDPNWLIRYVMSRVTDPAGKVTESYFDVEPHPYSGGPSHHYSRPYTWVYPDPDASGRLLSQRILARDMPTIAVPNPPLTLRQSIYVQYEDDASLEAEGPVPGGRLKSQRVVQNDDGNRYLLSTNNRYDGLGHYRETTLSGTAIALARTVETHYNRSDNAVPGDFVQIPANKPWITSLHDWVETRETVDSVTTSQRTVVCVDEWTGRLSGRRVERGGSWAADLYSFYTYDHRGNTTSEAYYGGDQHPVSGGSAPLCTPPSGNPEYKLIHTPSGGLRSTTKYDQIAFFNLDLDINAAKGLPELSRDAAGAVTKFTYDTMGRLAEIRPPASAWSQYGYESETAVEPAKASFSQWSETAGASPGQELTLARSFHDGFGRVIQQSRKVGASSWTTVWTQYDVMGRKLRETVPQARANANFEILPVGAPATLWSYDGLGRVRAVTQPDAATTWITYQGNRLTWRTVNLATATAPTESITLEEVDGLGRLVKITEDLNGLAYVTRYKYDKGDRLVQVLQDASSTPVRQFVYDGAGLLKEERHPETVPVLYTYDSRGNVVTRTLDTTPDTVIAMAYDAAERLKTIHHGANLFKQFFYDRNPSGVDLGKLYRAVRYNRHAAFPSGVQTVEETYEFGPGGVVSKKTTSVGSKTFVDKYTYDALGLIQSVDYPLCGGCTALTVPPRNVVTSRSFGLTTAVGSYADEIQHHANGLLSQIQHRNSDGNPGPLYEQSQNEGEQLARPEAIQVSRFCSDLYPSTPVGPPAPLTSGSPFTVTLIRPGGATAVQWYERSANGSEILLSGETTDVLSLTADITRTYFARVANNSCWADSPPATVLVQTSCSTPATSISLSDDPQSNVTANASVTSTAGATYFWELIGSGVLHANSGSSVSFTPGCGGTVRLKVTVTTSCGTYVGQTPTLSVALPLATVSGSATVATATTQAVLQVSLTGLGPWELTWNDGITQSVSSPEATRTVTLPAGQTTYTYMVTSVTDALSCSGIATGSATISVATASCSATVSGTGSIAQGSSTTIRVNLNGMAPWTVQWSDDDNSHYVNGSTEIRTVAPVGTTSYEVLFAVDSRGCEATISGLALVTVKPPRPTVVNAKATSTTSVQVTWSYTGQTDKFLIFRDNVMIKSLANPLARSYSDDSLPSNRAYVYHVTAEKSDTLSDRSLGDLATTVMFSSDPLLPGTAIQALHISQLRSAVAAVRLRANLIAASFTDPTLTNFTHVSALHINELRAALDAARTQLGLPAIAYEQEIQVSPPVMIRRVDVTGIRGGVQ